LRFIKKSARAHCSFRVHTNLLTIQFQCVHWHPCMDGGYYEGAHQQNGRCLTQRSLTCILINYCMACQLIVRNCPRRRPRMRAVFDPLAVSRAHTNAIWISFIGIASPYCHIRPLFLCGNLNVLSLITCYSSGYNIIMRLRLYTVSQKKTVKIVFVITLSNFN